MDAFGLVVGVTDVIGLSAYADVARAGAFPYDPVGEFAEINCPVDGWYAYDGDGLRAAKTVGSSTKLFTYDTLSRVPLLLTDGTDDYVCGLAGVPVEQFTSAGAPHPYYYFSDAHGSTLALTNTSGAIAGTYAYGAWGLVMGHTGTAETPVRFAGAYTDSETGFLYLQARYYDPKTALFLTVDALVAETSQAYIYADDNPANNVDPLGLESWYNPFTWNTETWAWVGVGLGATALALTGVGVIADLGAGAAFAVSTGAVAASTAGEAIDATTCFSTHDSVACAGTVLNGIAVIGGGVELAAAGVLDGLSVGVTPAALGGFGLDVGSAVISTEERNKVNESEALHGYHRPCAGGEG